MTFECIPITEREIRARLAVLAARLETVDGSRPPNNITIYWGNKATYNRHQAALDVQDGGNLRALAREFVKVVDHADNELRSTKEVWDDAAVVLFVNKFESLCRSDARFSAAYKVCNEKVVTNG